MSKFLTTITVIPSTTDADDFSVYEHKYHIDPVTLEPTYVNIWLASGYSEYIEVKQIGDLTGSTYFREITGGTIGFELISEAVPLWCGSFTGSSWFPCFLFVNNIPVFTDIEFSGATFDGQTLPQIPLRADHPSSTNPAWNYVSPTGASDNYLGVLQFTISNPSNRTFGVEVIDSSGNSALNVTDSGATSFTHTVSISGTAGRSILYGGIGSYYRPVLIRIKTREDNPILNLTSASNCHFAITSVKVGGQECMQDLGSPVYPGESQEGICYNVVSPYSGYTVVVELSGDTYNIVSNCDSGTGEHILASDANGASRCVDIWYSSTLPGSFTFNSGNMTGGDHPEEAFTIRPGWGGSIEVGECLCADL